MPVIRPSRTFEGSSAGETSTTTPYIREHVKKVVFNKTQNTNGVYLYFMPAYRLDSRGEGCWFKYVEIRDNFGDRYKEKYWVASRQDDPAEYFGSHHRTLYPEEYATPATVTSNGKTFKKYPNYGRITKRVLYNVAYASNLAAGVHVLDLPQYNGGSVIDSWTKQLDISGNPRPLINDPDAACPVFIRLLDAGSNPWQINVDASQPAILPEELTLVENLYNLEDILVTKPAHDIIAKLREMYSSDVFEDCMHGYPGLTSGQVRGHSLAQAEPVGQPQPMAQSAPVARPVAPVAQPVMVAQPAPVARPVPATSFQPGVPIKTTVPVAADTGYVDPAELPPNPMAAMSSMTREQAQKFLAS
jgi:hypothetical protein